MLERSLTVILTIAISAHVYGASIGTSNGQQPTTLLDSVNGIVNEIKAQQAASDTASTTPEPAPGTLNVCEILCPKWCQKVEGSERNFTDCHYKCGNVCKEKTWVDNPFIGNTRYEVVPSEYDFAMYDKNQDKKISVEEFARAEGIPADEARDLLHFSDFNKDGFIDIDEFQGGPIVFTVQMAAELSSISKNGNTVVTSP
ncbi:uncharacterized protein LOC123528970 [Mercenaria mercenaria]|uniref:uncharacterized protein LOC123528970 n=1 Tax=Mercenaria mercenaria TaxID=6596 RepID=UPI001E1D7633|nr:uncharacterized protein LOC123528970 [Mercenaria mercenaria]